MKAGTIMESGRSHPRVNVDGTGRTRRPNIWLVGAGLLVALGVVWIAARASRLGQATAETEIPSAALPGQVAARSAVSAPEIELLPPRTRRGRAGERLNDPRASDAIDRALGRNAAEMALLNELARARVNVPPVVEELFERRRDGASPEELRRFVRTRFPAALKLRMVTVRWIKRLETGRRAEAAPARPGARSQGPLGTIEPARR
jgi:hypothetical protein